MGRVRVATEQRPGCPVIVGPDSSRVATLVSEIISRSIPSGRSRSHALRCHRHALIMQMSLGLLLRAAVNERCTCIRVPSSGETSGFTRGVMTRVHGRTRDCRVLVLVVVVVAKSIFHPVREVNFQVARGNFRYVTTWLREKYPGYFGQRNLDMF